MGVRLVAVGNSHPDVLAAVVEHNATNLEELTELLHAAHEQVVSRR